MARTAEERQAGAPLPRVRSFGNAAASAQQQFAFLWGRESLLRLGLSLVLAIALWLYITGKENPTVSDYAQPLTVTTQSVGLGLTVSNTIPAVHVRIRLDNANTLVTPQSFRVFVNLLGLRPGKYLHVPVQNDSDPGIHIVQVIPSTVPVIVENQLARAVPVVAHIVNPAPTGYRMLTPRLDPGSVKVTGPQSLVSQVTQASVDVNLQGVTTSLQEIQPPLLLDSQGIAVPGGQNLTVVPAAVNVSVPVSQLDSFKTVPVLVPIHGQPRTGIGVAGVIVQPAEITAVGRPSILSKLSTISTAPISVSRRTSGRFSMPVKLRLPPGVQSQSKTVKVTIQLSPVQGSTSIEVGVVPQGVSLGMAAHTTPASVLVTVVGPSSKLANAGRSLRAVVDVTGDLAGTYYLIPKITPPAGLTISGVYPPRVTVSLSPAPTR